MTPPPPFALLVGKVTWQTFKDDQESDVYPEILHGTWTELHAGLRERNERGAGIYYTVNETDGEGRSASNITHVRAWYTDIDGIPDARRKKHTIRQLLEHSVPPSCIIETRNGIHAIWYAVPGTPVDKDEYRQVEEGIIGYWGGDPSAKDLSRVLRAPGFYHQKRKEGMPKPEPFEIVVRHEDDFAFYSKDELLAAFPPPKKEYKARKVGHDRIVHSEDDWAKIANALAAWPPVEMARHRVMTIACGVAIKFGIPEQQCVQDLLPIVTGWDTGRNMETELRRTAKWAYAQGTPATVTGLRNEGVDVPRLSRPKD